MGATESRWTSRAWAIRVALGLWIAREAVKNAAQHADANLITVTLDASDELCLTIRDDGVGPRRTTSTMRRHSVGIVMMRERAAAVGGHLSLSESRDGGTEVKVTLPWSE